MFLFARSRWGSDRHSEALKSKIQMGHHQNTLRVARVGLDRRPGKIFTEERTEYDKLFFTTNTTKNENSVHAKYFTTSGMFRTRDRILLRASAIVELPRPC